MQFQNFNEMIHAERGKLLRRLPPGARTICSAGCAGRWYFDWIASEYGPVDLHIGVELYSGKPEDLPENVRWIENSVSNMVDVDSGSVDLLISGQNIEHLYYDDLFGFLHEANRVVREGGYLCVDSPNRMVTQDLGYTQRQHVLELSVPEAIELIEAAGFSIVNVNGIWNCTDGNKRFTDAFTLSGDVESRCLSADDAPHSSFIWWIVAIKTGPVRGDLTAVLEEIVARSFQPFVASRFRKGIGRIRSMDGTETIIEVSEHEQGNIFHGPYVPLRAGRYRAEFDAKFLSGAGALEFDVTTLCGASKIGTARLDANGSDDWAKAQVDFTLNDYTEGVEARAASLGANAYVRFGSQIMRL